MDAQEIMNGELKWDRWEEGLKFVFEEKAIKMTNGCSRTVVGNIFL